VPELNLSSSAVSCRSNNVDFTVHISVLDVDGNCIQVVPLACNGLCYPYNIKDAIEQIVTQLNERIGKPDGEDESKSSGEAS